MGRLFSSILSCIAALATTAMRSPHHLGSTRRPAGWTQVYRNRFDPRINRHTGKPHEHKREIARRLGRAGA
jgi:hypothetical protein